jgi:hypothetical protein
MAAQPRWNTEATPRPVAAPAGTMASPQDAVRVATVIALTSIAAGAIHVAAAATLGSDNTENLAFFGLVATAQIVWGLVTLVAASRWWLVVGALGNAVVMATWIVSRTVGLPVGPYAHVVLPVGFADALATALEAVTIIGAAWLAARGAAPLRAGVRARGFAVAAAVVIGALAVAGVMSQANATSSGGRTTPTAPGGGGGYGTGGGSGGGGSGSNGYGGAAADGYGGY